MPGVFEHSLAGRVLSIQVGRFAQQANGAVAVRYGNTIVLITACASSEPREGIDSVPLTVDYEERLYAAGKIPGSFIRREVRPTEEAIITSRLIDRSLRPLLSREFKYDVQVVATVLSVDQENDPDICALIGASAALTLSDIPFSGPISAVHVGSSSEEAAQKAIKVIRDLTREVEQGEVYTGEVTRLFNFGAMVEILPGKEGLVHISELANCRVPEVEDVVKVGDEIMVKVIGIDNSGRVNLSRKAVFEGLSRLSGARVSASSAPGQPGKKFAHPYGKGERRSGYNN